MATLFAEAVLHVSSINRTRFKYLCNLNISLTYNYNNNTALRTKTNKANEKTRLII